MIYDRSQIAHHVLEPRSVVLFSETVVFNYLEASTKEK